MNKIAIIVLALGLSGCGAYSSGERAGQVSKISYKGLFCKTWEVELVMGGMRTVTNSNGDSGVVANIFEFTVEDEALAKRIEAAMLSGERVSLVYDQYLLSSPCSGSTGYFVTEMKVTK